MAQARHEPVPGSTSLLPYCRAVRALRQEDGCDLDSLQDFSDDTTVDVDPGTGIELFIYSGLEQFYMLASAQVNQQPAKASYITQRADS